MILIVETARELIETLATEIQTLEEDLKNQDSVLEAKKQLEMVNQELDSFDAYLTKRKSDKLRVDIRWFTQEKAYPYLSDKYYQNYNQTGQSSDRRFWTSKKIVTFSDTSESEGEGTSNRLEQSDNRSPYHDGFNQSNRFFISERIATDQIQRPTERQILQYRQSYTFSADEETTIREGLDPTPVFNLTSFQLDTDMETILKKGLSFVPSVPINYFGLFTDLHAFFRRIRLRRFFENRSNIIENNLSWLKPISTFTPSLDMVGPEIRIFENLVLEKVKKLCKFTPKPDPNLTKNEQQALLRLQQNKNIVIKPCNKGGGIVLLETDQYKQKVNLMLGVSEHYSKANNSWQKEVKKVIQEMSLGFTITNMNCGPSLPSRAVAGGPSWVSWAVACGALLASWAVAGGGLLGSDSGDGGGLLGSDSGGGLLASDDGAGGGLLASDDGSGGGLLGSDDGAGGGLLGSDSGGGLLGSDDGAGLLGSDSGGGLLASDDGAGGGLLASDDGLLASDDGAGGGLLGSDSGGGLLASDDGAGLLGSDSGGGLLASDNGAGGGLLASDDGAAVASWPVTMGLVGASWPVTLGLAVASWAAGMMAVFSAVLLLPDFGDFF
ncbi:hypothetical protein NDU88_004297 [Pleurodeles waltl]|uniref:Uncharacterized protein n=1 Tax=Pleurodeles waltl TaxID=8319 RepID=A0AAV7QBI1_PLEWA|nr:hypothetical protein NDU88_004297 [Pleurodeles waltl]